MGTFRTARSRSLERGGENFVGTHDFAAFGSQSRRKRKGYPPHNSVVRVRKSGPRVRIDVAGDGFLYKMVRLMVGAMARVALDKMDPAEIAYD